MTRYLKDALGALIPIVDTPIFYELREGESVVEVRDVRTVREYKKPEPKFKVGDRVVTKFGSRAVVKAVNTRGSKPTYWIRYVESGGEGGYFFESHLSAAPSLEDVISFHWCGGRASISKCPNCGEGLIIERDGLAAAIRAAYPEVKF